MIRVPARCITQQRHRCSERVQKSLSVRAHTCPRCGLVEDRDVNAARTILQAGAPPSGTGANGFPDELRSPRLSAWGVVTFSSCPPWAWDVSSGSCHP
jgi:transposase